MRDKSKVVRTALRAAKRRRYDIGGIADPYGMMETEEELRKKNPLYQNTGDLRFLNSHPYDPATDPTTLVPNTNAGQLGTGLPSGFGGALTPTSPKGNDLVPYDNSNYQPGAVQTFSLAPPANTVDPFSANITGALAGIPTAQSSTTRGLDLTPSTPAQVAALNVATNPNQMFTGSGKVASQAGQQLPGFLGPERAAFEAESKALMEAYGQLPSSVGQNQIGNFDFAATAFNPSPTTPQQEDVVTPGTFNPMDSKDVLGDVSYGVFGLSGPMGLSNAMQETNEQVDAQEAEQAAAEQAAAEQAAAAEAENPGGGDGDAPEGGGGGAPEGGGGDDEKRGGRIHMRHKYALDGVVDDILARKQESMDPRKALMFGETDQALPPTGLPIGQTVGTKAAVDVAKGLMDASDLTRQAMQGELPPDYFHSDEGIGRALNAAEIGMAGGVAGVPARAGQTVLGSGPIQKLMRELENERGVESARRLQRAADEIPNLDKLYKESALKEAFVGTLGDESLVMSMKPEDFNKFAAPYGNFKEKWLGKNFPKMTRDEYIQYLSTVLEKNGFSEVPYLQYGKVDNIPAIVNHEGRHRSDALALAKQPMSLVRLAPSYKIKDQIVSKIEERNPYWKPYQDEKLKIGLRNALPEDLRVVPQDRSLDEYQKLELPEPYKNGGSIIDKALMLTSRRLSAAKAPK